MNLDTIGLIAGVLTTAAWLPQLGRTWRTRSADGLSWPYLAILSSGIALWIAYGTLTANTPVVVANTVTITFVSGVIAIKATSTRRADLRSARPIQLRTLFAPSRALRPGRLLLPRRPDRWKLATRQARVPDRADM